MSLADRADAIEAAQGAPVAPWATMADSALTAARRAAQKQREATERRNAAIVAASDAGHSLREIAEAVNLSHQGVAKILQRRNDRTETIA